MLHPPSTLTVGAVGDSITTAFNASAVNDNLAHSWATGDADGSIVVSHLQRLRRALPHLRVTGVNVAGVGAKAADLAGQGDRLLPCRPDYVTILIGANDLPTWLFQGDYTGRLGRFASDVRALVQRLVAQNHRVMVLLSGIPDQSRILDVELTRIVPQAYASLWPRLDPSLLTTLRGSYRERWDRANDALKQLAESFPANVRFVSKTPLVRFEAVHLSAVDSYHPSLAGQRLLADVTWEQGWFPSAS